MSPNVYNVSYTHAAGNSGSASRGARYITRRPDLSREEREQGVEPTAAGTRGARGPKKRARTSHETAAPGQPSTPTW